MKPGHWIFLTVLILGLTYFISKATVASYDNPTNSDFFSFWLAGRMINSFEDPYSATAWEEGHKRYNSTWLSDPEFLYPLPLGVLFVPLSFLLLEQAFIIWVWITQILIVAAILILLRNFGSQRKHYILPLLFGLILFRPLTSLIIGGQISAFLLLIFIIAAYLFEKNNWFWGGVVISLTLLKPNLGVLVVCLVIWFIIRQQKYKALAGICVCGITLFLLGVLISPTWVPQYLSILLTKYNQTFGFSPTIWGLTFFITNFNWNAALVSGGIASCLFLAFYLVTIWVKKSITPAQAISLAIPIMLLITPYIWPYDQILLVFPIVQTMVIMKKLQIKYLGTSMVFIGISIASYILYAFTIRIEMENLNAVLTMIVLASLLAAFWLTRKEGLSDVHKEVVENG